MDSSLIKTKVWELGASREYTAEQYIRRLYNVLLRREPDEDGLKRYVGIKDLDLVCLEIFQSQEFRACILSNAHLAGRPSDSYRILLLGAYGNGNLGDAMQAASLARLIQDARLDVEIWSCSDMSGSYPFSYDRVLPQGAIHDPNVINQFDLLIVGGGGLFSHPHAPLNVAEWQRAVSIPVVIFGVGADISVIEQYKILISKAVFVSGRDSSSVETLKSACGKASLVIDPVLADSSYTTAKSNSAYYPLKTRKHLWILKSPSDSDMLKLAELIDVSTDTICFLEPSLDYWLITRFPMARPIYSCEDIVAKIDQADMVVSMRYHGCILSMLRGKPVVGIFEDKCKQLLERYGNSKFFFPDFEAFEFTPIDVYKPVENLLLADQLGARKEIDRILTSLLP